MSTQNMNYDLLEKDKVAILGNLDSLISIFTEVNELFLQIQKNDIWTGKRSDSFIEKFQSFVNNGVDGTAIISKLETEKAKIDEFMTTAISMTQLADQVASSGMTFDEAISQSVSTAQVALSALGLGGVADNLSYVTGISSVDASGYKENKDCGFVVTTDNKTYDISDTERELFYAIVAAEAGPNKDDALAVATIILNRCESPVWQAGCGSSITSQVSRRGQFEVYSTGSYKKYLNGNVPDYVSSACDDALNGVRNHDYYFFRSNGSTSYSNNMITSDGNRYGYR